MEKGRPGEVGGLAQADGGRSGGWGLRSTLNVCVLPTTLLSPACVAGVYFQGQLLDPNEKERSLMLKAKVTMTHLKCSVIVPDSTESFLKGTSARVISKLTGTGAFLNSGGNKALSKTIPMIN